MTAKFPGVKDMGFDSMFESLAPERLERALKACERVFSNHLHEWGFTFAQTSEALGWMLQKNKQPLMRFGKQRMLVNCLVDDGGAAFEEHVCPKCKRVHLVRGGKQQDVEIPMPTYAPTELCHVSYMQEGLAELREKVVDWGLQPSQFGKFCAWAYERDCDTLMRMGVDRRGWIKTDELVRSSLKNFCTTCDCVVGVVAKIVHPTGKPAFLTSKEGQV